jgi:hypothetical protein
MFSSWVRRECCELNDSSKLKSIISGAARNKLYMCRRWNHTLINLVARKINAGAKSLLSRRRKNDVLAQEMNQKPIFQTALATGKKCT